MKLLQICNVGNICGGTAACAWTIQRALPGWSHQVWFRSRPTSETAAAFSGATICHVPQINTRVIHESGADVALLHNIGPFPDEINGSPEFPSLVIQYHHSQGVRQTADLHVACSQWLGN